MDPKTKFKIRWTIILHPHLKVDVLRKEIIDAGFKINSKWADPILNKMPLVPKEMTLDLVAPSIAELGFPGGASRKDFYNRAFEYGLELCPPQTGPELRLIHRNQLRGEWFRIAMEPIVGDDGDLYVFGVDRAGFGSWLDARSSGPPEEVWGPDCRWIFVQPKIGA